MRGQCAAGAGLPEELRSSFLGVETFQEYSRTCWGCLEARQGPRRSAGTARRAKETRREHERAKETSREARSQQRAWDWRAKEFPAIQSCFLMLLLAGLALLGFPLVLLPFMVLLSFSRPSGLGFLDSYKIKLFELFADGWVLDANK